MSTLAAHAAMGLLIGVAIRVRPRFLPLVPVLTILPDLDHLDWYWTIPGLHSRMTFHNVWVVILLPLAVYALLSHLDRYPDVRELAGKAPAFMFSAVLLDMLSIEPLDTRPGPVALFYPLSSKWYTWTQLHATGFDPTSFGTLSLVLVTLSFVSIGTWTYFEFLGVPPSHEEFWNRATAYMVAWFLLIPALMGTGLVVEMEHRPPGPLQTPAIPAGEGFHLPFEMMAKIGDWEINRSVVGRVLGLVVLMAPFRSMS